MTGIAINIFAKNAESQPKGFFLQVQGASIDTRDLAADVCGQIGETVAFDAAVAEALPARARRHLVVVAADHAHTSQIVESPGAGRARQPAPGVSPAAIAALDGRTTLPADSSTCRPGQYS